MSKNLRKCMKTIHLYCCTESKTLKKSILAEMSKHQCFFEALYEVVNNIYLKNINLSPDQKKEARKFIKLMNKIHKHPKNDISRRKLFNQSGGFWQFALPILLPAVFDLVKNAVS